MVVSCRLRKRSQVMLSVANPTSNLISRYLRDLCKDYRIVLEQVKDFLWFDLTYV